MVFNNRVLICWGVGRFNQNQTVVTNAFTTSFSNNPLNYVSNATNNPSTVILGATSTVTNITTYRTNGLQPVFYYLAIGN